MMRFVKQRRCPECATVVHGQAMLCPTCGRALAAERRSEHCPACGGRLQAGGQVCSICGAQRAPARHRLPRRALWVAALMILAAAATLAVASWQLGPWLRRAGGPVAAARTAWQAVRGQVVALVADPTPTQRATAPAVAPSATATARATAIMRTPSATAAPPTAAPPTSTSTSTPAATFTPVTYAVAKGDVLGRIAARFDVSAEALAQANNITEETILSIGRELVIPITPTAAPTAQPAVAVAQATTPTVQPEAATVQPTASAMAAPSKKQPTSASPTPTLAPASPTPRVHVIVQGEHLGTLARDYGVSERAIAEANGIGQESILSIGQRLVIPQAGAPAGQPAVPTVAAAANRTPLPTATLAPTPATTRHVVAKGDTLGALAVRYSVATEAIAEANGLGLKSVLSIGQELVIPGVAPTPTTPQLAAAEAVIGVTPIAAPATVHPTASPTLTRMPTPLYGYREPRLLWPTQGSAITGTQTLPVLSWTSVGILDEDVWYRLRIWTPAGDEGPIDVFTKATSYRVPEHAQPRGRRLNTVRWQVQVVEHRGEASVDMPLSPPSLEYGFTWR